MKSKAILKILVSRPSAHHFRRAHQEKNIVFISLNLIYFPLQLIAFGESRSIILIKIRLYPISRSASMIEIHFTWYVENVKLFLSRTSQYQLVEKIENKSKIARAHYFFNFQRTINKRFLCGLILLFCLNWILKQNANIKNPLYRIFKRRLFSQYIRQGKWEVTMV